MAPETIGADHMVEARPLPQIGLFQTSGSSGSQMPSMRSALTSFMSPLSKPKVMRFHRYSGAMIAAAEPASSASPTVLALNFHSRNRPLTMKKPRKAPREKVSTMARAATPSVKNSAVLSAPFFVSHHTNSSTP